MLDYSVFARELIADLVAHVPRFSHIEPSRTAVLAAARCSSVSTGNLATCHGLRGHDAASFSIWSHRRSRRVVAVSGWYRRASVRITLGGEECRYLILMRLPRMLSVDPLETIVHELFHISPRFDGSLRPDRHGSRFDLNVRQLMKVWLARRGETELARVARMTLSDLEQEFGGVIADCVPARFRTPLTEAAEPRMDYPQAVARHYPGYKLDPAWEVRPAPVSPDVHPRALSEADLELRHFGARGARRISTQLARYLRQSARRVEVAGHERERIAAPEMFPTFLPASASR